MSNIVEFLTACLDEREAVALAAQGTTRGIWTQVDPDRRPGRIEDDYGDVVTYDESSPDEAQGRHIAANDPAAVLADIAAQRAIIEDYRVVIANNAIEDATQPDEVRAAARELIIKTLRMVLLRLASAYSTHPDYDESWRP